MNEDADVELVHDDPYNDDGKQKIIVEPQCQTTFPIYFVVHVVVKKAITCCVCSLLSSSRFLIAYKYYLFYYG